MRRLSRFATKEFRQVGREEFLSVFLGLRCCLLVLYMRSTCILFFLCRLLATLPEKPDRGNEEDSTYQCSSYEVSAVVVLRLTDDALARAWIASAHVVGLGGLVDNAGVGVVAFGGCGEGEGGRE